VESASDRPDDPRPDPTPPRPAAESAEEHVLIRCAQEGDERAFEQLVRRYEGRAWRVVRNMVPCDEDARDLVQEGFLRVFRNLERFDFQYAFSTWLYRILTNLAIDHLRRRRPVQSTSAVDEEDADRELVDDGAPAPGAAMESEETVAEVRACLATLAPHFQSVLVLRELEGLPCNEIAEIVGATHVTVRWRLHRGRKLFQEAWERRGARAANNLGSDSVDDPRGSGGA
jgi:RNA polymerase sigma-70 factor (ECF subfamily)